MTTFLLIRHATTEMNGRVLSGWLPDVHLNAQGRAEAALLSERVLRWPVAAIYSSPLERALETAGFIAKATLASVKARQDLGEVHYGKWTGMAFSQLEISPEWHLYNSLRSATRIPGGELMSEVQVRVVREIERLREAHPDQVVAVVSHGDVIRSALAYFMGIPLDLLQRLEISRASISVMTLDPWGPRILAMNQTMQAAREKAFEPAGGRQAVPALWPRGSEGEQA